MTKNDKKQNLQQEKSQNKHIPTSTFASLEEKERNELGSPFFPLPHETDYIHAVHFLYHTEYWASLHTDFSRQPHVMRFSSFKDLFEHLDSVDYLDVNKKMREHNQKVFSNNLRSYKEVLEMVLG